MGNNVRGTRSFSFDLDIKSRGLASLKLWTRLFVFFNIEKMYYLSAEKQPKWYNKSHLGKEGILLF